VKSISIQSRRPKDLLLARAYRNSFLGGDLAGSVGPIFFLAALAWLEEWDKGSELRSFAIYMCFFSAVSSCGCIIISPDLAH